MSDSPLPSRKKFDDSIPAVLRRRLKELRNDGYNYDFCNVFERAAVALEQPANEPPAAPDNPWGIGEAFKTLELLTNGSSSAKGAMSFLRKYIERQQTAIGSINGSLVEHDLMLTAANLRVAELEQSAQLPSDDARDAARYRWLREQSYENFEHHAGELPFVLMQADGDDNLLSGNALDSQIDAAMVASDPTKEVSNAKD